MISKELRKEHKQVKKLSEEAERFIRLKIAAEALRVELGECAFEHERIAIVTSEKVVFYSNTLGIPKEARIF